MSDTTGFLIYHSKPYMITNVILIIEHVLTRHVFDLGYKVIHAFKLGVSFSDGAGPDYLPCSNGLADYGFLHCQV